MRCERARYRRDAPRLVPVVSSASGRSPPSPHVARLDARRHVPPRHPGGICSSCSPIAPPPGWVQRSTPPACSSASARRPPTTACRGHRSAAQDAPARPLDDLRAHRRHVHARLPARAAARLGASPCSAGCGPSPSCGVTMKLCAFERFRPLQYALYPVLGWAAVFAAPALVHRLTRRATRAARRRRPAVHRRHPVLLSGRPDPWPRTFGYHEVWHTFTVAAGVCHFATIGLLIR